MSLASASQEVCVFDLPHDALYTILHKAGPRSRQLCRALLDLYGPLPRLTPRGVATADELLSTLARSNRHSRLSALDLSHAYNLITDDNLQAICRALPSLSTLRLPPLWQMLDCRLSAASVAHATSQLRSLTCLHVPHLTGMGADSPLEWPISGCAHHLQDLSLPAPLAAKDTPYLSCMRALSKLSFHGPWGSIDMSRISALVEQLPALVALDLGANCELTSAAQLWALTQLTSLTMQWSKWTCQHQQHLAHLTSLRSLDVDLSRSSVSGPDDAEQHVWLTRLTLLTSLYVYFHSPSEQEIDEVVWSVPHLPALCELSVTDCENGATMSAAACAHIASARSSLRHLRINDMSLPAVFTEALEQLTGLTCLRVVASRPAITSFDWLTALTALRELWCTHNNLQGGAAGEVPCELLAGLPHLHTLSLCDAGSFVDGAYLERLCASVPRVTSLDLSGNGGNLGAAMSALQHLTNLEVLGLGPSARQYAEAMHHVRSPLSLRRCYLGDSGAPEEEAAARAMLGRQVEVVFSDWQLEQR